MELSTREQRCLQRNKSKCQRHIGFSLHASPHRTFTKEKIIVPFYRDQDEALRRLTHLRKAKLAKSKCPVNMRESTGHTKGGEWWGYWATLDQNQHHRAQSPISPLRSREWGEKGQNRAELPMLPGMLASSSQSLSLPLHMGSEHCSETRCTSAQRGVNIHLATVNTGLRPKQREANSPDTGRQRFGIINTDLALDLLVFMFSQHEEEEKKV